MTAKVDLISTCLQGYIVTDIKAPTEGLITNTLNLWAAFVTALTSPQEAQKGAK